MAERDIAFDMLKGIGIIGVLIGHLCGYGLLRDIIYNFHLPLFFFCSGYFYKRRPLSITFSRSVRQLLIPYLFFAFVLLLATFLLNLLLHKDMAGFMNDMKFACSIDSLLYEKSYFFLTIWFLVCLFESRLLYALLDVMLPNSWLLTLVCIILYIIFRWIRLPLFLDTSIAVLIFFHLGRICHDYHLIDQISKIVGKKTIIAFISALLYLIIIFVFRPSVELKECQYPLSLVFCSFIAIISLTVLCRVSLTQNKTLAFILSRIGVASLTILGLHRPLWLFLRILMDKLTLSPSISILIQILLTLVILVLVDKALKRYCPTIIGKIPLN